MARSRGENHAPAKFELDVERPTRRTNDRQPRHLRKSRLRLMSIVAPMSPTTQRCEHSLFRRRKSMSFAASRNIKVIYSKRMNLRHRMSFCRLSDIGGGAIRGEAVYRHKMWRIRCTISERRFRGLRSVDFRRSTRSAVNFHPASAESQRRS